MDHIEDDVASGHDDSDSSSEELFGESNDSAASVGNSTDAEEDVEDQGRVPSRQEARRNSREDEPMVQDDSQGSGEKCKDTDDVWDCVWDGFDDGAQQDPAPPERSASSASRWDRQSPAAAKAPNTEEVPQEMLDSFFFEEQGGKAICLVGSLLLSFLFKFRPFESWALEGLLVALHHFCESGTHYALFNNTY